MQSVRLCAEPLCVPAFLLLLMTVIASCVIFWLEKHFGPDEEQMVFESIPHAMWFVICTISTVGYGDVAPRSVAAKTASATLILGGVCYMAMPLAIIGGTFVNVYHERDRLLLREKTLKRFAEGGITPADLRSLFEAVDQDCSGAVKRSEFVELVEAFKLGLSRGQIIKLFQSVDTNGSGEITFDEFAFFLFPDLDIPEDEKSVAYERSVSSRATQERIRRLGSRDSTGPPSMRPSPSASPKDFRSPRSRSGDLQAVGAWLSNVRSDASRSRLSPPRTAGEPSIVALSPRPSSPTSPLASPKQSNQAEAVLARVERLEIAVAQLGAEQRRHFEAQQRILEDLAAKFVVQGSPSFHRSPSFHQPPSTRLPSSENSPREDSSNEVVPGSVSYEP